jgi:hypothetical protein
VTAAEYVASWVPSEYLPDRPEELAVIWQARAQQLALLLLSSPGVPVAEEER